MNTRRRSPTIRWWPLDFLTHASLQIPPWFWQLLKTATLQSGIPPTAIATQHTHGSATTGRLPGERRSLIADLPHAGFLVLRLRDYAAWRVRVNGRLIAFGADPLLPRLPERNDGLMAVPVSAGRVELDIAWATTRDEITGRWISALALLLTAGLYFAERRSYGLMAASQSSPPAPRLS